MKIEVSVEELKQLIKQIKNTPVAGTTDANISLDGKEISSSLLGKCQNC